VLVSTEDLRTPDVTAPLGALGQEASGISLAQMTGAESAGNASDAAAAGSGAGGDNLTAVGMDGLPLLSQMQQLGAQPQQQQQQQPQQQQQQQQPQQQGDLHHLLMQVEQQLQLDAPGAQQQLSQREQQVLLLAQAQQQQQQQHQQQQQQQMNDLVLAQQQLMLANAAGGMGGVLSNNQAVSAGLPGQAMLNNSFTAGGMQRGRAVAGVQQQLVPILLQDAAGHRGESFTSQCSTSSFVSGIGALRAAAGSLPVSPLIDRSAHSFTITDRSMGSFSTLGSVPERPHSFSVGDRPQVAALLANLGERPQSFTNLGERPQSFTNLGERPQSFTNLGERPQSFTNLGERPQSFTNLGERPQSFTLMDVSRPNSFTIGQRSPAPLTVERSSASFSVLERSQAAGLSMMDGGLSVVERSSDMQQSFTLGQRPQLQHEGVPWYERDAPTGVLAGGQADGNGAVYQLVAGPDAQQPQQPQQQLQGNGRLGLNALWQWR